MGQVKTCSRCKKVKDISLFSNRKSSPDGKRSECKECQSKYNKKWVSLNKERKYTRSKWWQKETKYGVTEESYNVMLNEQEHKCAICGMKSEENNHGHLYVDHDHSTNKIRGLLCRACNSALGLFKESVDILENAKNYLIKFRQ